MAESIKYKKPDTYHDAGNVYDSTQGKTQEQINASMIPTDEVSFTEQGYTVSYCKSGNIATVIAYRDAGVTTPIDFTMTQKLPFRPYLSVPLVVPSYRASDKSYLKIDVGGEISIVHNVNEGFFKCVATFIAKGL